jgi:hypothetical protein
MEEIPMLDDKQSPWPAVLCLLIIAIIVGGPIVAFGLAVLSHHGIDVTTGDEFYDFTIAFAVSFLWFCTAITTPLNFLAIAEAFDDDKSARK